MPKKKYTPEELMKLSIEESLKSVPEHKDKADPFVGAIITSKGGEILATAHRGELRIGEHCEFTLIERKLKDRNLKDCILYVTLEPCVDEIRNSPKRGCSTHITKARISTVYVGMRDPDPKMENKGVNFLKSKGIEVIEYPAHLENEIRKSNAQFIKEKELEQMRLLEEDKTDVQSYMQKPVTGSTISEFDEKTVKQFLQFSGASFSYPSDEFNQWAQVFEIATTANKNMLRPTRLGLILFGKEVENVYPHTIFKTEIDYGNAEPEIKDFGGPIVNQLTTIIDYIKSKALKLTIDRSNGIREERTDFPIEVLREAIANAIIHRDYENERSTNYLFISPNKIIVRSPGVPEAPLTINDLKTFDTPSISRNPKIMFVFNKMGMAEQRGIGLKSMKILNDFGFPLPTFDLKAGMLQVTFGRTKEFLAEIKGVDSSLLTEEDKNGLIFIQERKQISVSDYASYFDITLKTAGRRLKKFIDLGLIVRTGAMKGTKYHLK